jgi:hypothetical protein
MICQCQRCFNRLSRRKGEVICCGFDSNARSIHVTQFQTQDIPSQAQDIADVGCQYLDYCNEAQLGMDRLE